MTDTDKIKAWVAEFKTDGILRGPKLKDPDLELAVLETRGEMVVTLGRLLEKTEEGEGNASL